MIRTKWTERTFNFDFPEGWLPNILERLRGTQHRITAMTANLSDDQLGAKHGGKWSMKEHIGHLGDLEELHTGRMDDFAARLEMLRPADMSNAKTEAANHNLKSVDELIRVFEQNRALLITRLEKLDDETQFLKSMHPRLQTPMRPVDVAFFAAEHDDHHLASMRVIIKMIEG